LLGSTVVFELTGLIVNLVSGPLSPVPSKFNVVLIGEKVRSLVYFTHCVLSVGCENL
jgi:hypothetical protein